ncbi:MAG TPA: hypothetical protein VM166_09130 [Gemmatimonadaceae bacterium]|nr:hypothetical protein [Gemmatimonadaceae bacterium]
MNRTLTPLALLLFLAAAPAFALDPPEKRDEPVASRENDRATVIDDVIRMSKAGVDDEAIIKFVRESRNLYVVDADVIIALTDAKVSKPVLEAVMDEGYDRGTRRAERRRSGRSTRTVYVSPYYGYDPWFYSPAYNPYWYGPRLSFGFGFGHRGGYYRGHHRFRGRR